MLPCIDDYRVFTQKSINMHANKFQLDLIDMQGTLLRYACTLTSDREKARELVQDTIIKALKFSDSFAIESNFRAWLFTIMKNTFINEYRRNARHRSFHININDPVTMNQLISDGTYEADSIYSAKEMQNCIEKLNDVFRVPFKMYLSGYKYKEIAEELKINIGTIKSRIFLSRKKIQDLLSG